MTPEQVEAILASNSKAIKANSNAIAESGMSEPLAANHLK